MKILAENLQKKNQNRLKIFFMVDFFRACLGYDWGMFRVCLGVVLGMFWVCFGYVLGMFWTSFGLIFGLYN